MKTTREVPYKNKRFHSKHCLTVYLTIIPLWMLILSAMFYFDSNNLLKLAEKPAMAWVQLNSGATIIAEGKEPWYRTDETVINLAKKWAFALTSWSGKLGGGEKDLGVAIGSRRMTLPAWEATTLLTPRLQPLWRNKIAEMTPTGVFRGTISPKDKSYQAQVESVLYIENREKLNPVLLKKGYWQIDLIAHISLIYLNNFVGENIPFNLRIVFKAIPYLSIDPYQELSSIQIAAINWRSQGLEIIKIEELKNGTSQQKRFSKN